MRNFSDELVRKIAEMENPTVLGLDPKLDYIPDFIKEHAEQIFPEESTKATAKAIWLFNKAIIDATCDIIPAIKVQYAYYEMYGIEALKTMYAEAILGNTDLLLGENMEMTGSDAVTVNPYLGIDGVKPFIDVAKRDGKGVFVLVRTSNPSAGDFQDLEIADGRMVYEVVASKVNEWGEGLVGEEGFSSVGAVVGATWPEQAVQLRRAMPKAIILVPGYGAQGATADEAVASFTADGKGSIVNASRSIMTAWHKRADLKPEDFAMAARFEAQDMKSKLNAALKNRKYV